jgi:hypothetical protein
MKSLVALCGLLAFGPIGVALAAGETPPGPPTPAPEMAQLKIFDGGARCTGKQGASQFGPEHPTRAVARGRIVLNGFFLTLSYDERKTKQNPYPLHIIYTIGYDASAKQYIATGADNLGGRISETASGWDGDKLTFTGELTAAGQKIPLRDTFTKIGDKEIDHVGELHGADGKWIELNQQTCPR